MNTQHGQEAGVLLGVEEYETMQQTIELLQDVRKPVTQINEGKGVKHSQARQVVSFKL